MFLSEIPELISSGSIFFILLWKWISWMLFILSQYNFSIGKPISFIESTIFIWQKIWVIAIRWLIDTFPLVGEANPKVDIFYNWILEWSCETVHVCVLWFSIPVQQMYISVEDQWSKYDLFPSIGRTVEPAKLPPCHQLFHHICNRKRASAQIRHLFTTQGQYCRVHWKLCTFQIISTVGTQQ